jgi:chemotaxis protein CheZ
MSQHTVVEGPYTQWVAAMGQALSRGDEAAFQAALVGFDEVRDSEVVSEVRKVAFGLQSALERFHVDSKLIDLAQRQVPDARHRLAQVLRLTDDAAHRTMDLVEQCCPLAVQTVREAERIMALHAVDDAPTAPRADIDAFLIQASGNMAAVRSKLGEVLMAQGYQDLSGQIIRGVMQLVDELESALGELVRIGGGEDPSAAAPLAPQTGPGMHGPVVPGIDHGPAVGGQQDVDSLLSDLGM